MLKPESHSLPMRRRAMRGVTLFELIITIAIVAILAGLALPNYREFSMGMTVTENTNDLIGALNSARTEAVRRGRAAAVIANGGSWNDGWQVVVADETSAGVIEPTPTSPGADAADCDAYLDTISDLPLCVRYRGALPAGYRVFGKGSGGGASSTQVVFTPAGALQGASAFDFSVCRPADDADATKSRRIRISAGGVIESHRDTTGSPAGDCN